MRELFLPGLLLVAVAVICVVVLIFHPSWFPQVAAHIPGMTPPPAAKKEDKTSPFVAEKAKGTARHHTGAQGPELAQDPNAMPPAAATSAREGVHYPFPQGSDIALGLSKSDVMAAFGPAEVIVTGTDLGRLNERLVYWEKSTGKKTVVFFVNGKVSGATTFTQ